MTLHVKMRVYTYACEHILLSLPPTSRQPPENIKATKEILQIQNLLWGFQGFHGFLFGF